MKLSISNIAWASDADSQMYQYLADNKIDAIEIAPTRIFPNAPYDLLEEAADYRKTLTTRFGLQISSIQSIWYGRTEKIFGSLDERRNLLEYTKKAIDFASVLGCSNLVFGCPKNRIISKPEDYDIAKSFFSELGEYAANRHTVLALEANPVIYNTNFMNTTEEAIQMVKNVNSPGCLVNLDVGTIIYNEESLDTITENLKYINHIHISEPNLAVIKKREIHKELFKILKGKYNHFVSIEMGKQQDIKTIYDTISYIREVFL